MGDATEIQEVKEGPWSPDECYLAVWTYDRLDEDRSLDERTVLQELADRLGRTFEDAKMRVHNVAACDPRPLELKPTHGDAAIQGKLRLVFSEYWSDREAGRIRAGRLLGLPEESEAREIPSATAEEPVRRSTPADRDPCPAPWRQPLQLAISALAERASGMARAEFSWLRMDASPRNVQAPVPWMGEPALKRAGERIGMLRALPVQLHSTWCARPFPKDALQTLAETARELDQRTSRMKLPPPPDPQAFEKAKARWKGFGWNASKLERREVRLLCQHPETALFPSWVDALAKTEGAKIRRSWVENLLGHYLAQWRTMPLAEELEASLRGLLDHLPSQEEWARELSRDARILIGADVPKRLLRDLSNVLIEWEGVLLRWELSREVGLGYALMLEALNSWGDRWRSARPEMSLPNSMSELRTAFQGLLQEPGVPNGVLCRIVSNLILSEWAKNEPEMRECLVELVLRHPRLGDPRKEKQNWYPMAQARDRLIGWMARKDLRLFYDSVVADHADDQGRKAFWLRYVDCVSDFRLVLCEEDVLRLKATVREHPIQFARMEGSNKTSAFILRFKSRRQEDDLICVEFSKTGNSLYTYNASSFEAGIGHMEALYFRAGSEPRDLKNKEYCRFRKPHIGDWQSDVSEFLWENGVHAS